MKSNKVFERVIHGIFLILGLVTVACVLLITVYLVISGIPAIMEIGLRKFLFGKVWNPHHNHYVATGFYRYFLEGHEASYAAYWNKGARSFFDHQTICLYREGEETPFSEHLVMYEDGKVFDPEHPRDMEHLEKNNGFENAPIVLKNKT